MKDLHLTLDEVAANPLSAANLSHDARALLLTRAAGVLAALSAAELAPPTIPNGIAADPAPALLTAAQIAARLGIKESWVMTAARAGRIPRHMIGRYPRFNLAEVEQALAQDRAAKKQA